MLMGFRYAQDKNILRDSANVARLQTDNLGFRIESRVGMTAKVFRRGIKSHGAVKVSNRLSERERQKLKSHMMNNFLHLIE